MTRRIEYPMTTHMREKAGVLARKIASFTRNTEWLEDERPVDAIERALADAYAAGQRDMRERAAAKATDAENRHKTCGPECRCADGYHVAMYIRTFQGPPMSDDELQRLKEAAKAATPGPWAVDGDGRDVCDFTQRLGYDGRPPHEITGENGFQRHVAADDARHIAAANPDAILRLLARLEAAERVCAVAGEVYEEDDVFTVREANGKIERDDALAQALAAWRSSIKK
jgi:hypothetical protein